MVRQLRGAGVRRDLARDLTRAVTIRHWEQAAGGGHDVPPAEVYGQVEDFEYDDSETFRLTTFSFAVEFTASRLTITPEPRQ